MKQVEYQTPKGDEQRPLIFLYHDYRAFLKIWIDYLRKLEANFSLRLLSRLAKLSPGYLPLVLAGSRSLSKKNLDKLLPFLHLSANEKSYLKLLLVLDEAKTHNERVTALKQLQRYHSYQNHNLKELESYQYLSKWYFVAIRELAATSGFKADVKWIQKRLVVHVAAAEIEKALKFLVEFGFLKIDKNGKACLINKNVDCLGGVYQLALADYHRIMLAMAADSIDHTEKDLRQITGYTLAITKDNIEAVKKILADAQQKIAELESAQKTADGVYHVGMAFFPLTKEDGHEQN